MNQTGIFDQHWSFERIARRLSCRESDPVAVADDRTRAAVAMILHQGEAGIEMLFIQRAPHELDPWSGHIAFPGGKLEEDEAECQAACRETAEETGIDLVEGRYLGRLSDIVGSNLPVKVSCCLFGVNREMCRPVLNDEVSDLFWVSLADLRDPDRSMQSSVAFGEKTFHVPAIRLPIENKPVLWGITYRLVIQFLEILDDNGVHSDEYDKLPAMVEIDEEVER